jgi:hypothetical protein
MVVFIPLYSVPTQDSLFGLRKKGEFYNNSYRTKSDGTRGYPIDMFLPEHFCTTYSYGVEYDSGTWNIPSDVELAAREKESHNLRAFISYSYCE